MVRLIHDCFLGLRRRAADLIIDPVMPVALDGLRATVDIDRAPVTIEYRIGAAGWGPQRLTFNGSDLSFEREANPYRTGGAVVAIATLRAAVRAAENTLTVYLG
jgi:cellobiose phosphorylase